MAAAKRSRRIRAVRLAVATAYIVGLALAASPKQSHDPLWDAAGDLRYEQAEGHLKTGVNPNVFNELAGSTPLGIAVGKERNYRLGRSDEVVRMVKLLLQYGADANRGSKYGRSPLLEAAILAPVPVAKALVDGGADLNVRYFNPLSGAPPEYGFNHGQTPLAAAIEARRQVDFDQPGPYRYVPVDRTEMVRYLLSAGANPNVPGRHEAPPLHIAAYHGLLEYVEILLWHGAGIDDEQSAENEFPHGVTLEVQKQKWLMVFGFHGYTALHCAAMQDTEANARVVRLLLAKGARTDLRDRLGRTAYEMAVQKRFARIVRAFEEGAPTNHKPQTTNHQPSTSPTANFR